MNVILLLCLLQDVVKTNDRCIECHVDPDEVERRGSVHLQDNVSCVECHGGDTMSAAPGARNPHGAEFRSRTARKGLGRFCGACHGAELESFAKGAHYRATMTDEGTPMRACLACHDYHGTKGAERGEIWGACVKCHPAGTAEHDAGKRFNGGADAMERAVVTLEERLRLLAAKPGILYREEEAGAEAARAALREMRVLQHSLDYPSTESLQADGHDRADAAYNTLDGKERRFGLRFAALGAFLLVVGLSAWLVHKRAASCEQRS